jgi:NAD(P)-dependent dehydrogenase (short-subunit alcohol dehydrogenase family)
MSAAPLSDVPLTVIGGRGPHGLTLHLWLQDRDLTGYRLVDAADDWLLLYGPSGPMQAVGELRSPRELDFSLGCAERGMAHFTDEDGSQPLAGVYSLQDAACETFNLSTTPAHRAPRLAFWRYANCVARRSGADAHVLKGEVVRLEPLSGRSQDSWRVPLADGRSFGTAAVVLATGLGPHLRIPLPWQAWRQHLPEANRAHALKLRYADDLAGKRLAVTGSANLATWEAAIRAAEQGAKVTLLSRAPAPIEWQLPFPGGWFREATMAAFMALPAQKRLRILKKTHIPNTALPGLAARAEALGVRVLHHARVQYASPLWGGVQLQYRTASGECAEYVDLLVAATGVAPRLKELPLIADAARAYKAPVVVGGPVRHRPILDDSGRWKNLPPLYPMGAHALMRAGFGANTLASATVYLLLTLPHIVKSAGLGSASVTEETAYV